MRNLFRFLCYAVIACSASGALAQQAGNTTGLVVSSCGVQPQTGIVGNPGVLTLDTTGKLCVSAASVNFPITGSGATVVASAPLLDLTQTWNNAAVVFTGLRANFTPTASNAGSLLLDLQNAGATQWSVRQDGIVTQAGALNITAGGVNLNGTGNILVANGGFRINGVNGVGINFTATNGVTLPSGGSVSWSSTVAEAGAADVKLTRVSAGAMKLAGASGTGQGIVVHTPGALASLPACSATYDGAVASINDGAAALAWGASATSGAAVHYLVYCNAAAWTVAGK